jgi:hypothetical protein
VRVSAHRNFGRKKTAVEHGERFIWHVGDQLCGVQHFIVAVRAECGTVNHMRGQRDECYAAHLRVTGDGTTRIQLRAEVGAVVRRVMGAQRVVPFMANSCSHLNK